jgi:hypothetical protein
MISSLFAQENKVHILVPENLLSLENQKDISYLPANGLNLYDAPNGKFIGRLDRDRKSKNYENFLLNIFLYPQNRTPELIPLEALAPLSKNRYAIPIVKEKNNFLQLFDNQAPYFYWIDIEDVKKAGFRVTDFQIQPEIIPTFMENGAGLIIPDFEKLTDLPRERYVYMFANNIPLYADGEINEKSIATLSRFCPVAKYTDGEMRMFILPNDNPNNCIHLTTENLHHLSDDTYVMRYYKRKNQFLLLFDLNNIQYWANIEDIVNQDFRIVGWKDYFIENRANPCYANDDNIVLRESPYDDAKILVKITDDRHQILITGFEEGYCEGQWCKVTIIQFKENPCRENIPEEQNIIKKTEGWIKLIDDNGFPTVHFNTKGC